MWGWGGGPLMKHSPRGAKEGGLLRHGNSLPVGYKVESYASRTWPVAAVSMIAVLGLTYYTLPAGKLHPGGGLITSETGVGGVGHGGRLGALLRPHGASRGEGAGAGARAGPRRVELREASLEELQEQLRLRQLSRAAEEVGAAAAAGAGAQRLVLPDEELSTGERAAAAQEQLERQQRQAGEGVQLAAAGSGCGQGGEAAAAGGPLQTGTGAVEGGPPKQPPRYSHYSCIGRKFDDDYHKNSCEFQNVCLNTASLEVEYYMPPELGPILTYDQAGHPLPYFQAPFLDPGHSFIEEPIHWEPKAMLGPFPSGEGVKWAEAPVAVLAAIPPEILTNIGHVLYDVLTPVFNLMHLHRVYSYDAQVLVLGPQKGTEEELSKALETFINPPPERAQRSLLRLISRHPAMRLAQYAQQQGVPPGGLLCFRRLLAGTGTLNRQMDRTAALPFRQAVLANLGLRDEPQERPLITFFNKRGRRLLENALEISEAVRQRYPAAEVRLVEFSKRSTTSMEEQVSLMSRTSLLITPCGGLAAGLVFMRPGAQAITLNHWNTQLKRSEQMDEIYYRNIEYLRLEYFPVGPEDYANTRDRPDCELRKDGGRSMDGPFDALGALVHCNVRIRDVGRMMHYVDMAMMRWAAENGRYDVLPFGAGEAAAAATA